MISKVVAEILKKALPDITGATVILILLHWALQVFPGPAVWRGIFSIIILVLSIAYMAIKVCREYLEMMDTHRRNMVLIDQIKLGNNQNIIVDADPAPRLIGSSSFSQTASSHYISQKRHNSGIFILYLIIVLIILSLLFTFLYPYISNLSVLKLASTKPIVSTIAPNPYPYYRAHGSFAIGDSLSQASGSAWQKTAHCVFREKTYHISTTNTSNTSICTGPKTEFADFAFEVKMSILKGDCGGIFFRGTDTYKRSYFYRVCQDKNYQLIRIADNTTNTNINHPWLADNGDIHAGQGQNNTIGFIAQGNKIWLYVNKVQISCILNNSYGSGFIALAASSNANNQLTEVSYSDLKIWKLTSGGNETCV